MSADGDGFKVGHYKAFPSAQKFPKNSWYIAAASQEVGRHILKRKVNGAEMVLFRRQDGSVAALRDACPHKGFPLSKSVLIGDDIRCGYHGIAFDGSGKCTNVPSQDVAPSAMRVKAFPVVENWQFIWVWVGDPEKAAQAKIPSFGFEGDPTFQEELAFSMEVNCNAQFLIDNVLDHTHFTYLHAGGLDSDPDEGGGDFTKFPQNVEATKDTILSWRELQGIKVTGVSSILFGVPEGVPLNRRIETRGYPANGYMVARDRFFDPETGALISESVAAASFTPMDDDHVLHVGTWNSSYEQHEMLKPALLKVIAQDTDILPDIHRHYKEDADAVEFSIVADKASILSRRIVEAAWKAEQAESAAR